MITRVNAYNNLQAYIGQELGQWANEFNVTIEKNGKYNKGWKGVTLEALAGVSGGNKKAPNGLGFEIKSVAFRFNTKNNIWMPKETMAINMLNPTELIEHSFYQSHTWEKLKCLLFCAVSWEGNFSTNATLLRVATFDFLTDDSVLKEVEEDYEFIREKLKNKGFSALTGKDGKWIQTRTKGAGHGSTSRAFYARKNLINHVFNL